MDKIDLIAVTVGPGLEPALWTGITFAQELRESLMNADKNADKRRYEKIGVNPRANPHKSAPQLIGVNHLEGHLYSFLLPQKTVSTKSKIRNLKQKSSGFRISNLEFPAITLLVSGGHTTLLLMKNLKTWKRLGETKDDAAGEAFDKVARMLGLPYPGGPEIERLALSMPKGEKPSIAFPRPMLNQKNYDFSFSGLKTAVLYHLRGQNTLINADKDADKRRYKQIRVNPRGSPRKSAHREDVAASFQQAVIDVLIAKTMRAAAEYGARSIILCGGVAANKSLRKTLKAKCDMSHLTFHAPDMEYNNDNAAMIAAAGYFAFLRHKKLPLEANGDLNI